MSRPRLSYGRMFSFAQGIELKRSRSVRVNAEWCRCIFDVDRAFLNIHVDAASNDRGVLTVFSGAGGGFSLSEDFEVEFFRDRKERSVSVSAPEFDIVFAEESLHENVYRTLDG